MQKQSIPYTLEYSHYNLPVDFPIIGLTGPGWTLPDGDITFLHCHNCLELGFCHGGSGILLVENKQYSFEDYDISVVCPNTMHISKSSMGTRSQWEYLYIDTNRLFKEYLVPEFMQAPLFMFDSPDFPNIVSGRKYPELKNLFLNILKEFRDQSENYQLNIACLSISFLLELTRLLPKESKTHYSNQKTKLAIYPAIQYIDKNYAESIKIEKLSSLCSLSLTHFRRIFKAIMGESPLSYLNRVRINKSCELLYNTEESVLDIALKVGFSSNTSYNRNFTALMNTTPLQWRKKSRTIPKNNMNFSIFPVPQQDISKPD